MKEIESFADVADTLPEALAAASPHRLPADLRARVLRAAEARAGRSSRRFGAAATLRALAAAAALAVIAGLVIWNVQLQQALAQDRTLLQQLRDSAGKQPLVFDIVDSSQSQKVMLRATGPRRPGEDPPYGKLYTNPNFTQIIVMTGRLPAPASDHEYRLTLTSADGTSVELGPLSVDASGFAYVVYETGVRGPSYNAARLHLRSKSGGDAVLVLSWTR